MKLGNSGRAPGWRAALAAMLLAAGAAPAQAQTQTQTFKDGQPVFASGAWTVHRITDPLTDSVSCVAAYGDSAAVQLGADVLRVGIVAEPGFIRLRFDDGPVSGRLARVAEFRSGFAMIKDADFEQLLAARRLRGEVVDSDGQPQGFDLDLAGLRAAHARIVAGCPGPALAQPAQAGPARTAAIGLCPAVVVGRLKQRGLAEGELRAVCAS